jgi:hypothetical protein
MKCDPTAPPRYPAFTLYSSPSTAGTPLTPTSETSFADPLAALDFYDLCNPEVIGMSPQRGALHHSASYTYGAPVDGQYPNGFSQE